MTIRAQVHSGEGQHHVTVSTNGAEQTLAVSPKTGGRGSSVNGGELLFLALATCYCNDVYREAAALGIDVRGVDVEVDGEFGGAGEPATSVRYRVAVTAAGAAEADVRRLIERTDAVAEIQNTLRAGADVRLDRADVRLVS